MNETLEELTKKENGKKNYKEGIFWVGLEKWEYKLRRLK